MWCIVKGHLAYGNGIIDFKICDYNKGLLKQVAFPEEKNHQGDQSKAARLLYIYQGRSIAQTQKISACVLASMKNLVFRHKNLYIFFC